ncbi:MAG: tripartite tricarboxylate transporter substrate binding protein [Burkholderiales bacterium]|nr:tripartite tricarboxylate transporter substrate binding protein [Burkholderiales bacterium]
MRKLSLGLIASALLLPAALCAQPVAYPNRPITMIVSVSAGGSIDTIARALAEEMARGLGRPVTVDNRPGANGNLAATAAARAPADGHTLLVTGGSTLNLNPHLYRKLPFDPQKDLAPITLTARTNLILVVHPKLNVDSVESLVALARAQPGKLNYGSAGNGSLMHIATELFNSAAGVDTRHIPYKGLAPAVTDILAGNIDFMFDSATTVGHIKAGKLKALAVVGPNPLPALPQLKVLASHGIRGVEVASGWHGLFVPAGTPAEIVARLNAEAVKALNLPAVRERVVALGAEPASSTPSELAALLARDLERLGPIVKKTGATLD